MKKLEILYFTLILLFLGSCSNEFDNYKAPDGGIYGTIVDSETGKPVPLPVQGSSGTILKLMEQNNNATKTFDFYAFQDGTFKNTYLFSSSYVVSLIGPFVNAKPVSVNINGQTKVDIPVTPYARIDATASITGKQITINYTVNKTDANFVVSEVYGYWNFAPGVDNNTSNYAGKVITNGETGTIIFNLSTDANFSNNLFKITSNGNKIYVRIGAKTEGYINYSQVITLTIG